MKKFKFVFFLSVFGCSNYLLSMEPSADRGEEKGEAAEILEACANLECGKVHELSQCSRCKKVKYCSRACQSKDWKTHKVKCNQESSKKREDQESCMVKFPQGIPQKEHSLIERCQKDKTLATKGYPELGGSLEKTAAEIIQVGLGHKRVAYFTISPDGFGNFIKESTQWPLKFARANGAIAKQYIDVQGFLTIIVYQPKHEEIANYFIDRRRTEETAAPLLIDTIFEGILLGYERNNIKAYLREKIEEEGPKIQLKLGLQPNFSEEDIEAFFSPLYQMQQERSQDEYPHIFGAQRIK